MLLISNLYQSVVSEIWIFHCKCLQGKARFKGYRWQIFQFVLKCWYQLMITQACHVLSVISTNYNSNMSWFISDIKNILQYVDSLMDQYSVYFRQSTELDVIILQTKFIFQFWTLNVSTFRCGKQNIVSLKIFRNY